MIFIFHLFAGVCSARPQKRSPSVIVIGGGIAGLAAARALQDASFKVFDHIICILSTAFHLKLIVLSVFVIIVICE